MVASRFTVNSLSLQHFEYATNMAAVQVTACHLRDTVATPCAAAPWHDSINCGPGQQLLSGTEPYG